MSIFVYHFFFNLYNYFFCNFYVFKWLNRGITALIKYIAYKFQDKCEKKKKGLIKLIREYVIMLKPMNQYVQFFCFQLPCHSHLKMNEVYRTQGMLCQ